MTNILNPYIAGAPVVETSMFFGREDIFGWIERSLTGKFVNHILVLHGQRRVGKTSVLKQIPRHLPKHYVQVFFDLQGRTNTTLDRFLWWMASEISRTIKKECNLDLPKIERSAFVDPDAFINDFLPSLRSLIGEKILLLTFDEFDTLDRPDIQDSLARPLIAYLRRLMEIEGLNFIFSIGSSGNKLENMQASYTDFFKSALYRKVSFLTKDDCVRLITKPVEGTITYEPEAVDKISTYTSGHPYFTQLMCHELFSRCQKTGSRTIKAGDVDSILDDVIERGTVNLKFVWDEASDLEKWILAALAQEEGATLKRVHQILKGQGLRSSEAELNSAILHLRDKDVLDAENGFVIQLMKLWLQSNRPMDRVREELVQTNPIADRYLEIGDEYRERGEYQQAIQSYEQALAVQENSIRALQNIATIYTLQNTNEEAVKYFARILLIDEENIAAKQGFIQAQMFLAKQAIKDGLESDAEKAIRSILMIAPAHVEATKLFAQIYVQKAELLLHNGLEDQAMEKFQQAMEISPDDEAIRKRYEKIIADKKAAQVQGWLEKAEKSLARQRWDEAASMVEEALNIDPENPDLQKRLLEIKDAPRQEKIQAYKKEAEQAIAKGNYPKAINAIQTATLLAPEDLALKEWLASIQGDQANAQLRLHQSQADQAEAAGNWEAAIAAREAALKQHPDDQRLIEQLQKTRAAKQQAQIKEIRSKIVQAKQENNWEAAILATQEYLQLSPDDQEAKKELALLKGEQQTSKVRNLRLQAEAASKAEKWEEAIQHWQTYLAEQPEDQVKVGKLIEQAKQKAALLRDYETAQAHIKKRQYNRAIHLLQGIIAKDPTYKASSRLLVEAVEANKQKKPISKTPWVYAGFGIVLVAVVVIILLPKIKSWVNPSQIPAEIAEVSSTPTISASPTPAGRVLTVNNTNDTGVASLRYALMNAQEYDTIIFNPVFFPPEYPGTIFLESELPRIWQGNITLDASYAGVILDGSQIVDDSVFGLIISSDYNKVMGLQIVNFTNNIGIYVEGGSYNQIGGDRNQGLGPVGQGNLISNNGTGIDLLSTGGGNIITGNLIGTQLNGITPMGNVGPGITIEKNESISPIPNTIGPDNIIAYNNTGGYGPGIELYSGMLGLVITENSIFGNGGKGINYLENDAQIEPPVIIYHDLELGVVSGQTCSGCEIEIFSTYRNEGNKFEGKVKADDFGNFVFDKSEALAGPNLTAVAISSANKTSEFSDPPSTNSAMKSALAMMEGEPTYQTSFDVWEFGEQGENVEMENGQLILSSDGSNIGQGVSEQSADKFAVQFEFQIPESDPEGTCFLGMGNDELRRSFGIGFRSDGISFAEQYVHPDQFPRVAEGNYEYFADQRNEGLVIVVEDQISVLLNDQLVFSFFDPQGSVIYNFQSVSAEWGVTCEFDNYKVWNLEGLEFEPPMPPESFTQGEFYPQILRYISDAPPTFEDDFSTPKEEWGKISVNLDPWSGTELVLVEHQISDFLENEKLNYPIGVDQRGYTQFPTNSFLDANHFIISFEFKIIQNYMATDNDIFAFKFHQSIENDSTYDLHFTGNGNWELVDNKISNNQRNILYSGTFTTLDTQHVMIAVFNNNLIVQINDQITAQIEGITSRDYSNSFNFTSTGNFVFTLDNIKFWNLDGVEIAQEETEDQANQTNDEPSWMTDFVNPVMEYIDNRSPDIEDNFDNASSNWKLIIDYISFWNKSFEDGEMIITGEAKNILATYFDYVAEVEIRRVSGTGWQGIGWDNGSEIRCKFNVHQGQQVEIWCNEILKEKLILSKTLDRYNNLLKFKIIVKNGSMAFYLNDELIGHYENEQYRLYRSFPPTFYVGTSPDSQQDQNTAGIDNFRVWNITDLELP